MRMSTLWLTYYTTIMFGCVVQMHSSIVVVLLYFDYHIRSTYSSSSYCYSLPLSTPTLRLGGRGGFFYQKKKDGPGYCFIQKVGIWCHSVQKLLHISIDWS